MLLYFSIGVRVVGRQLSQISNTKILENRGLPPIFNIQFTGSSTSPSQTF